MWIAAVKKVSLQKNDNDTQFQISKLQWKFSF